MLPGFFRTRRHFLCLIFRLVTSGPCFSSCCLSSELYLSLSLSLSFSYCVKGYHWSTDVTQGQSSVLPAASLIRSIVSLFCSGAWFVRASCFPNTPAYDERPASSRREAFDLWVSVCALAASLTPVPCALPLISSSKFGSPNTRPVTTTACRSRYQLHPLTAPTHSPSRSCSHFHSQNILHIFLYRSYSVSNARRPDAQNCYITSPPPPSQRSPRPPVHPPSKPGV